MTTYDKHETDGTGTLKHMLMVAIFDYQRRFGHEPKLIVIPFWRGHEMPRETFKDDCSWTHKFRGIRFEFGHGNVIELSGDTTK